MKNTNQRISLSVILLGFLWSGNLGAQISETDRMDHWFFTRDSVSGSRVKNVSRELDARINGPVNLLVEHNPQALFLNGTRNSLTVSESLLSTELPRQQMSVEAWVQMKFPMRKGSLISTSTKAETLWSLGYRNLNFAFRVPTTTSREPVEIVSESTFIPNRWYHLVATYDGKSTKLFVNGLLENQLKLSQGSIALPDKVFYEIGVYKDAEGTQNFTGLLNEVAVYNRALTDAEVSQQFQERRREFEPSTGPLSLGAGPFLEFISRDQLKVTWETTDSISSGMEFGPEGAGKQTVMSEGDFQNHEVVLDSLHPETIYTFQLKNEDSSAFSPEFTFDTTFNYQPFPVPDLSSPYSDGPESDLIKNTADLILEKSGINKGYCLVLDSGNGQLAFELARKSNLKVVAVEKDPDAIKEARNKLVRTGLYGSRISIHQGNTGDLPYGSFFANLIVSGNAIHGEIPGGSFEAVYSFLRPAGGKAVFGSASTDSVFEKELLQWVGNPADASIEGLQGSGHLTVINREKLSGSGEWTHQYGHPDNASCSKDQLIKGEMDLQWWGRPGPRPMPDRGPRNPAPVSANGRLYVQGFRVLFGIDSYNGTILWSQQIPRMRRANMPRDCSNMAASDEYLYMAIDSKCFAMEGETGARAIQFSLPPSISEREYDWGYVAVTGDQLIGSGVRKGSHYLGDDGEWYQGFDDSHISRLTSDYLFSSNRHSRDLNWVYRKGGVLINSTITIAEGVVYFIESRNPATQLQPFGRMFKEVNQDQYLVALDLDSGRKLWEKPYDFSRCQYMVYLQYSDETLLVVGSDKKHVFHAYAFVAKNGEEIWTTDNKAVKTHHTSQLEHPVLIGDRVYVNLNIYDLKTGDRLSEKPMKDYHGCGIKSASSATIFFRQEYHSMWNLESGEVQEWHGIRSGCWLSMIPSGGLLLAPETSAGCSCTHAIQTSIAYRPRELSLIKPGPVIIP